MDVAENVVAGKTYRLIECEPEEVKAKLAEVPERAPYVMFASYPDIMTREQAAEALGMSMNMKDLGEKLMSGEIRAYRDGRRWRIPKISLIEYVEERLERRWYE